MKADKAIATYRRMRAQPLWRLLASTTGPTLGCGMECHTGKYSMIENQVGQS